MASLQLEAIDLNGNYHDLHQCGGTLIAPSIVLSAAHCLADPSDWFGDGVDRDVFYGVEVGRYNLTDYDEEYESFIIEEVLVHPDYNAATFENDFMLLKLFGHSTAETVSINDSDFVPSTASPNLVSIGWGDITPDAELDQSDVLKQVDLKYVTNQYCSDFRACAEVDGSEKCYSFDGKIFDSMICAEKVEDDVPCSGPAFSDSGGPLFVRDGAGGDLLQVGIVRCVLLLHILVR